MEEKGKEKRTGDYFMTTRSSSSIVGGKIMNSECKIFSQNFRRNVDFINLVFL